MPYFVCFSNLELLSQCESYVSAGSPNASAITSEQYEALLKDCGPSDLESFKNCSLEAELNNAAEVSTASLNYHQEAFNLPYTGHRFRLHRDGRRVHDVAVGTLLELPLLRHAPFPRARLSDRNSGGSLGHSLRHAAT